MKYATLFLCLLVAATILNPSAPAAVAVVALALLIAFDRYADALAAREPIALAAAACVEARKVVEELAAETATHRSKVEDAIERHGMRR